MVGPLLSDEPIGGTASFVEPPSVPCPVRLGNPITTKLDPRTHSFLPMKHGFYADI